MTLDPRTPVLVGVGQTLRRPTPEDAGELPEPVDMMADALRLAGRDSGSGDALLRAADAVLVVDLLSWRYADAAALVAERLGATPRRTVLSTTGGNSPQMLVNDTSARIARGELDVALITGCEAIQTRAMARKAGTMLEWTQQPEGTPPPDRMGVDRPGSSEAEMARSLVVPTQVYPLFENALRAASGATIAEHQVAVSELWARFSQVAAGNAAAWSPQARSAEEIRTVGADNRMIGFPYSKLLCANIQTDQAAGLVLCSAEAARRAGVPEDRWVFPHAGADSADHWFVSERADLHTSPAMAANGRIALGLAQIDIDDVAHVDLYSCFPAAVQMGAAALGLSLDRQLTVTGGLTFFGGPGNSYVNHSIASMVDVLRADPDSLGVVTALGWYATKHAIGVYSTRPPAAGFRTASPQAEVDALPRRQVAATHDGAVTVETSTVMHERDGSRSLGIVACLLDDGRRAWGNVHDHDALQVLTSEETAGWPAHLAGDGTLVLQP